MVHLESLQKSETILQEYFEENKKRYERENPYKILILEYKESKVEEHLFDTQNQVDRFLEKDRERQKEYGSRLVHLVKEIGMAQ